MHQSILKYLDALQWGLDKLDSKSEWIKVNHKAIYKAADAYINRFLKLVETPSQKEKFMKKLNTATSDLKDLEIPPGERIKKAFLLPDFLHASLVTRDEIKKQRFQNDTFEFFDIYYDFNEALSNVQGITKK